MVLLANLLFDPGRHTSFFELLQQALQAGLPQGQHVEYDRRLCRRSLLKLLAWVYFIDRIRLATRHGPHTVAHEAVNVEQAVVVARSRGLLMQGLPEVEK